MQHGVLEPFIILGCAVVGGFCSSAPLGAINLWITDRILAHRESKLTWFLIGVIGMDCVHASLAAWGYHTFLAEGVVARWLTVLGGAFLVILGALSLLKRARQRRNPTLDAGLRRPLQDLLLGAFMCGANPAFLVFWVFVINLVERQTGFDILGWRLAILLAGIVAGDALWFRVFFKLVCKGHDHIRPRLLAMMRTTIAAAFVGCGTLAMYHGFKLQ